MKRIEYIFAVVALCFSLQSCHFLEVEKIGKSDIESFFETQESVSAAVIGCMNLANSLTDRYMILYPEICGDLVVMNASETGMWSYLYNFDFSEAYNATPIGFVWNLAYELVLNACEIIDYAPSVMERYPNASTSIRNSIAQARYLRALATFDLALCYSQHYGYTPDASHLGVVVMESFPNLNAAIVRSSASDTYAFILSDLHEALNLFVDNPSPDPHYPSSAAAKALLARVYLYMEDYENALAYASDLIDNYSFSLTPRDGYFDMFTTISNRGTESIFRLDGKSRNSYLNSAFDYQSYYLLPSSKLLSVFAEDNNPQYPDIRSSLMEYDGVEGGKGRCMKYTILEQVSDKEYAVDVFVSRLSEMYLIRAEALCCMNRDLDQAASDIAVLRSRATGRPVSDCIPQYTDASSLAAEVAKERIKELYHEGHRLFDITRRRENLTRDENTTSSVKYMAYPNDDFIFPIPGIEMEANKQMQPNPNNETQR